MRAFSSFSRHGSIASISWVASLSCAAALLTFSKPAGADTLLDDFEGATPLAGWTFTNGPEFPGASGGLTVAAGHTGQGAHLAFDLSCTPKSATCDPHYVAAVRALATPLDVAALSFWMKSPPGIHLTVRITDDTGQTLQYPLSRPVDANDATAFYPQGFIVGPSSNHFGGANDGAVHGKVHSIAILADDPFDVFGQKGEFVIDDLRALNTTAVHLGPGGAVAATADNAVATLSDGLGVNIHFTNDDPILDSAKALGISFVRMDLAWGGVERTSGVYDFTAFDTLLTALDKRAMRALFILDYGNKLHSSGASPDGTPFAPATAAEVNAFGDYVAAAVTHFKGRNVVYEVWNEPNIGFWRPTPSPTDYAALCKVAIARAHGADASAKIPTGGLAGFDFAYLRSVLTAGGATGGDALGVHPYRQNGGETVVDDLLVMRTLAAGLPGKPTIWDTEWGYSSQWYAAGDPLGGHAPAARDRQAVLFAREVLSAWTAGFPRFVLYDVRDDGDDVTDAEHNFGIFGHDDSDKPAAVALRALHSATSGHTARGWLATPLAPIRALSLQSSSDEVIVAWMAQPGGQIELTIDAAKSAVDHLGAPLVLTAGTLTLKETDGPIYLTYDKTLPGDAATDGSSGDASSDASDISDSPSPADATADSPVNEDAAGDALAKTDDSSGCGCDLPGRTPSKLPWTIAAMAIFLASQRRRRRA